MQLLKTLNTTVLAIGIFLCVGGFIGLQVAFGHGLGDILYYAILYPLTLTHLIWTIKIRKAKSQSKFILPLAIFSVTTFLFCLKATIWRGPEYSWDNGSVFFTKGDADAYVGNEMMYEITNAQKTDYISVPDPKEKYLTELKVSADKDDRNFAFIDSGTIVKPDTLRRYLQNVNEKRIFLEGKNPFSSDSTLKTSHVKGQVRGVRNNQILFYVSTWWTEENGR